MDTVGVGKVVNTHGVKGEIKILPYTNTPEFFIRFKTLVLHDIQYRVLSLRVHAGSIIAALENVRSRAEAEVLRGSEVFAFKSEAALDDGEYFVADLIGLRAIDDDTNEDFGKISDFLTLPSNGVYVVAGEKESLIPAVSEFVRKIDIANGCVRFKRIEGM